MRNVPTAASPRRSRFGHNSASQWTGYSRSAERRSRLSADPRGKSGSGSRGSGRSTCRNAMIHHDALEFPDGQVVLLTRLRAPARDGVAIADRRTWCGRGAHVRGLFICAKDLLVESIRGVGATTHKMTSNCSLAASLLLD